MHNEVGTCAEILPNLEQHSSFEVSEYYININLKFLYISSFYVFWNWRILMLTHLL